MVPATTIPIYRIIHIDNLLLCLKRGGMHAPNYVPDDGLEYKTIHNREIQLERHIRLIPCGQKGTIHDYLPFYFGVLSPMLLQLCTGRVAGYDEGPSPLIYAVSTIGAIIAARLPYVFSDGHGIATFTDWFDDIEDLDSVDWDVVPLRCWSDTISDPDRQRRKQAEFMVHKFCPWTVVQEIGVYDDVAEDRVQGIIGSYSVKTPVQIQKQWYY